MEDPKPFAVLMEHIKRRVLREILEDAWKRYVFKTFVRVSVPSLFREPKVLRKIRVYEITLKIINNQENFKNHVKNLIAVSSGNTWGVLFEDMVKNDESRKEYITLAKRLQDYIINYILLS